MAIKIGVNNALIYLLIDVKKEYISYNKECKTVNDMQRWRIITLEELQSFTSKYKNHSQKLTTEFQPISFRNSVHNIEGDI